VAVRLHAHRLDARVRPASPRHLFQSFQNAVHLVVIDGLGAALFPRHAQAFRLVVDGDDASRSEQERAFDRELAHRPAAPDSDRVFGLNVTLLRGHVASGKNIGEEQHLFVRVTVFDFDRPDIGERHARVLRLPTGVTAEHVRVTEDSSRRMAEHFLCDGSVRI
jgi:hypothetical protein